MIGDLIQIGYTKKPHGLKGEVKLEVEERYVEDIMDVDVLVIEIRGKQMPYFVEDIRVGNNIIAKFEDVNTPEKALEIGGKSLFLRTSDLIPDEDREIEIDSLEFEKCIGYTIIDNQVSLGIIEEVIEFPQQEMAFIKYNEKEVMIPLNEHFIRKVDHKKKQILMELPYGLLDL
jgi:16S rRNA processing protein RimM